MYEEVAGGERQMLFSKLQTDCNLERVGGDRKLKMPWTVNRLNKNKTPRGFFSARHEF